MTGCHAEAQSRAAQGSGIWELWTVISPKFSTHFVLTTVVSNIIYGSSSPDVQQLGLPGLRPGRSPTAWVLALLITSLLAHNKLYILYFVGASSPTQPDLNQSSSPAFRREKLLRYLLHRGTAGIQHTMMHVSVRMAWISFRALPCRGGKKKRKKKLDGSSHLDVAEIACVAWHAPLSASVTWKDLQFGTWTAPLSIDTMNCVLWHREVGRAKYLSAPPRVVHW